MATQQPRMTANQRTLAALTAQVQKQPRTEYQRLDARAKRERWEDALAAQIATKHCLPPIERQALWHPRRRYVADFLSRQLRLIIEVDGGLHVKDGKGAHNNPWGYERDRIRDAEAILHGYTVLRVTPAMIERGEAVEYLVRIVAARFLEAQQRAS